MGFDMVIARDDGGGEWFACGWDVLPLYNAVCDLGEREEGFARVPTGALRVVEGAAERMRENPMWAKYARVALIDYELAEEWFDSVGVDARADMALAVIGDVDDPDELAVLRELWRLTVDGWSEALATLGAYVRRCREDGVESVVVHGG